MGVMLISNGGFPQQMRARSSVMVMRTVNILFMEVLSIPGRAGLNQKECILLLLTKD